MEADYPGAIVVEAANYGYNVPNQPVTWGFHTPEEPADSYPSTPEYLATTDRDASYTYFVSYLGFVFQLVPESEGAYAHGLEGKPEPSWSDGWNLNLQSLSVSFEGYTATITQTMPRGSPQWNAGVNLVAHRTRALGLNLDWAFQHKDVSIYRSDCGQWDQVAFIADVKAKMEDDMGMTPEERSRLEKLEGDLKGAYSQIAWLRSEVGVAPEFDPAQAHDSTIVARLDWLKAHAQDADYHHSPEEIRGIVGEGGGYTDQQAVKAVKDAL